MGNCNCSKRAQPTGFAKTSEPSTERLGAQATQRTAAASVPGAVTSTRVAPTGSR